MQKNLIRVVLLVSVLAFAAGSAVTFALLQWTRRIPSLATLKTVGVGVYEDPACTISVTQIDWGILEPGDRATFDAYIQNLSNVPITLTIRTDDWSPVNASAFISLSWDYDGTKIPVDTSIPVTLTLDVDAATSGFESFSFTIVIIGSG